MHALVCPHGRDLDDLARELATDLDDGLSEPAAGNGSAGSGRTDCRRRNARPTSRLRRVSSRIRWSHHPLLCNDVWADSRGATLGRALGYVALPKRAQKLDTASAASCPRCLFTAAAALL